MKNSMTIRKLITSVVTTVLLLFFMINTSSNKLIFIPFLICSISMVGKCVAQLLKQDKAAVIFQKLFVLGFLLFVVGFLIVACYVSIRDKNYSLLIFSIPFWLVAFFLFKNKFLKKKPREERENGIDFRIVISGTLVTIALLAGVFLIILGFKRVDTGLIFAGAFFAFGAFSFVMAALMLKGCFEKFRIDIFGLYVGIFFVVFGLGITLFVLQTQNFGLWILIPVLMAVAGAAQIIKCLRNRNGRE